MSVRGLLQPCLSANQSPSASQPNARASETQPSKYLSQAFEAAPLNLRRASGRLGVNLFCLAQSPAA